MILDVILPLVLLVVVIIAIVTRPKIGRFSDNDILREMKNGNITIEPFNPANLSDASYDLRLGNNLIIHKPKYPFSFITFEVDENGRLTTIYKDVVTSFHDLNDSPFMLNPGEFVLGHTHEIFGSNTRYIISELFDKSTPARTGISSCFKAAFGDPGNSLRFTLEIKNNGNIPIELKAGMHIAQGTFSYLCSPSRKSYTGKYLGDITVRAAA